MVGLIIDKETHKRIATLLTSLSSVKDLITRHCDNVELCESYLKEYRDKLEELKTLLWIK